MRYIHIPYTYLKEMQPASVNLSLWPQVNLAYEVESVGPIDAKETNELEQVR